jgi:AcrR family transcriptional regulator
MGGKFPNADDRRVHRTVRTLSEALTSLMLEKSWESVSVKDICEHADVGRSTFYTHFADKEDLLVTGFNVLRQIVRAEPSAVRLGDAAPLREEPLRYAHDRRHLFVVFVGKNRSHVVARRFRELIVALVREDLAVRHGSTAPTLEPAVHFIAGAFIELLAWWLGTRNSLRPSDIERLFFQMATPGVELILRASARPEEP